MFVKGQLVECVKPDEILIKGAIYTVRFVANGKNQDGTWGAGIEVYEARPPCPFDGFDARRFRPLQDSRLDVFRALLVPKPAPVFVYEEDGA